MLLSTCLYKSFHFFKTLQIAFSNDPAFALHALCALASNVSALILLLLYGLIWQQPFELVMGWVLQKASFKGLQCLRIALSRPPLYSASVQKFGL